MFRAGDGVLYVHVFYMGRSDAYPSLYGLTRTAKLAASHAARKAGESTPASMSRQRLGCNRRRCPSRSRAESDPGIFRLTSHDPQTVDHLFPDIVLAPDHRE